MHKIVLESAMGFLLATGWGQSPKSTSAEIAITAENPTIVAGDPVCVSMQFENTSDHPFDTTIGVFAGVDLRYRFHITAENGAVLEPAASTKPHLGSIRVQTIQPGEKEDYSHCLNHRYPGLTAVGIYKIYVTRIAEETTVKSNEIAITVVPGRQDAPQ